MFSTIINLFVPHYKYTEIKTTRGTCLSIRSTYIVSLKKTTDWFIPISVALLQSVPSLKNKRFNL